jgi:hypothetical protein
MSRTKHGAKGPGYEYWSKRPGPKMQSPGRPSKTLTHRAERRVDLAIVRAEGREEAVAGE